MHYRHLLGQDRHTHDQQDGRDYTLTCSEDGSVVSYAASGSTYDPKDGGISTSASPGVSTRKKGGGRKKKKRRSGTGGSNAMEMAARICALCNDSTITSTDETEDESGSAGDGNGVVRDGSPTEAALRVLAEKISASLGLSDESLNVACPASLALSEECPVSASSSSIASVSHRGAEADWYWQRKKKRGRKAHSNENVLFCWALQNLSLAAALTCFSDGSVVSSMGHPDHENVQLYPAKHWVVLACNMIC